MKDGIDDSVNHVRVVGELSASERTELRRLTRRQRDTERVPGAAAFDDPDEYAYGWD